jgi:hypothetical protein
MELITDKDWNNFINYNRVSDDIIDIIALRIMSNKNLSIRELAIYQEHSKSIENLIKKYTNEN